MTRLDGFALSGGTVSRWDGAAYHDTLYVPNASIHGAFGRRSSDVWAFGSNGTLAHFDGSAWDASPSDWQFEVDWTSMTVTSPGDLWVAGRWTGLMLQRAP